MNHKMECEKDSSLGVLIIGSLYWDPARKEWRAKRLNLDGERFVRAPPSVIDSPSSLLQTGSTTGSTQRRRCRDYSTWCVNPMAALTRSVPLAPE